MEEIDVGWFGKKKSYDGELIDAIMGSERKEAMDLVKSGASLEEKYDRYAGSTPLLMASATDQWDLVEFFIEYGANIWAYSKFGMNVGDYAEGSRVIPDCPEGQALQRVRAILHQRGFPSPAPHPKEVVRLAAEGKWPPAGAH
ncbi:hypothetical protein AA101099_1466 [Neoasaia chiangmaiensis NBRC 101099]|uniref:hypothetical protein n=1 Tax=Neoasaia chiangmaiensis TaxID=320497 RepID=UPI001191DE2B|nr:hypothetical protein [Neoasaia chiangmaiensis]GBR38965.1 hypothetical protein AA101099_1466 [Neoasaia chiangmaiensis NBRC 101099]GEN15616.1 hypothetical protein NCH01_20470 [Neoasaia chiangmaiensis]